MPLHKHYPFCIAFCFNEKVAYVISSDCYTGSFFVLRFSTSVISCSRSVNVKSLLSFITFCFSFSTSLTLPLVGNWVCWSPESGCFVFLGFLSTKLLFHEISFSWLCVPLSFDCYRSSFWQESLSRTPLTYSMSSSFDCKDGVFWLCS